MRTRHTGRHTFADVERLLAFLDGFAGTLEDTPWRLEVLEQFRVWGWYRVPVEITNHRRMELSLLRAMDGGIVGQAGVEPWLAITA